MSIDDKYDEIKQLVYSGKEKGYLLYDEVNDVLPSEIINSSDDIDELFTIFDSAGIEVVDSEEKYQSDAPGLFTKDYEEPEQAEQEQDAEGYAKPMILFECICEKWGLFHFSQEKGKSKSQSELKLTKRI